MSKAEEIFNKYALWTPSPRNAAIAGVAALAGGTGFKDKQNNIGAKGTAIKSGIIGATAGALKGAFQGKGLKGMLANTITGTAFATAAGGLGRSATEIK